MTKKYELLKNDTIEHHGRTLYRIRALIDFGDVKAGDLGGYIQYEHNLSQKGICWIYDNAIVYDNASVSSDDEVDEGTESKQNNTSKPQLELISPEFILALGRALTNGSEKYGYAKFLDFNDKDFILNNCTYQKHIGAAMRHIEKWRSGIDFDEESGEHHLMHAASRLMMIYAYSNDTEAAKLLDNRIYKDVE